MKTFRTWVVVADGQRARVLENTGAGKGLASVTGHAFEINNPASRGIASDRPGRVAESYDATRHAYEARTDPHREAKRDFIKQLADVLDEQLAAGKFDHLVLLAPPQALGDLRSALSDGLKQTVSGELNKDLTKVPDSEFGRHLESIMRL